jgi:hypothetical protein
MHMFFKIEQLLSFARHRYVLEGEAIITSYRRISSRYV